MLLPDHNLLAGVAAGAASSLLLHPLDVLKVRLQVDTARRARPGALREAALRTWRADGARGFYRGAVPGLLGSGASWGLYFALYERCKRRLLPAGAGEKKLSTAQHMYAAWEAGSVTCLFTNPMWLIKTRMQLQTAPVSSAPAAGAVASASAGAGASAAAQPYRGVLHALECIVREEGLSGLYRGLVPALLLTSHGMIQFAVYEELKERFPQPAGSESASAAAARFFAFGIVSKAAAVTVTYPSQVVKARLQQRLVAGAPLFAGVADCVRQTLRAEGPAGLYKGFVANLARVAPQSAVTLVVYEAVRDFLAAVDR
jgi:solute carrier family 25 folate transporter 32